MANSFWLVVADASKARFFEGASPIGRLQEIHNMDHPESRIRTQDINTDAPGRRGDSTRPGRAVRGGTRGTGAQSVSGSGAQQRSAMTVDTKEQESARFAQEVVGYLEDNRKKGAFESLSIVADPSFLGEMRKLLSKQTQHVVLEEVAKDVVNQDIDDIKDVLERLAR